MTQQAECEDCARALAGLWLGYRAGCTSCAARAIARSPTMFDAAASRAPAAITALREACTRALPTLPLEQARAEVMRWWRHDKGAPATALKRDTGTP